MNIKPLIISFLVTFLITRTAFSMQERRPEWFNEVSSTKQNIESFGEEFDASIDLVAGAYIDAGGGTLRTGLNDQPLCIEVMIFGGGYFDGMAKNARRFLNQNKFNYQLSISESDYLTLFAIVSQSSMDIFTTSQQFYFVVNKYRRENSQANNRCSAYFSRLEQVLCGLEKPQKSINLYRYISCSDTLEHKISTLWDAQFSSCSSDEYKTKSFSGFGSKSAKIVFLDVSPEKCRILGHYAPLGDHEDEVMLLNSKGKIKKIEKN